MNALNYFVSMHKFSDRREFLKILIGGTGAAYLALQGCGRDASSEMQQITGYNSATLLKRQRHSLAHKYLRDKSFDINLLKKNTIETDIVIIGGGASGLAAAITLQDAGYSFLLLENEAQLGGAGVKGVNNGISYPYGSVYFVDNSEKIQSLCKRAGKQCIAAPEDAVLYQGQLIENFWSDKTISSLSLPTIEKDGMKRFRDVLLNDSLVPTYPLPKKLNSYEAGLDAQSSRKYLSEFRSPFLETLLDLYSKSSMGASIDETNAYSLLNFYSAELGSEFGKERFTFSGGMNGLYQVISSLIKPEFIKTESLAFALRNTTKGVEVDCIGNDQALTTITAKKVIMTGQKHIAPFMIDDLSDHQKSAMMSIQYPPYATIHLESKEELFPNTIMDVWTPEANGFCTDIICSNSMNPPQKSKNTFMYSIFGAMPLHQRSLLLNDVELAKYALDLTTKTMKYLHKPMDIISSVEVFAWGHALAIPNPGSHNGPAQLASRTHGNIHFGASDNDAASSVENALANGFATAEEIIQKLS